MLPQAEAQFEVNVTGKENKKNLANSTHLCYTIANPCSCGAIGLERPTV
jgi:hypothetical protein